MAPRSPAAARGSSPEQPSKAAARGQRPPAHAEGDMSPQAHRAALERHLASGSLKWTRQREAILSVFLASTEHLTSEELLARARRRDRTIGATTVYRTLKLFVEADIATERKFQDGVTRYEVRRPHHDHLICLGCGAIVEFEHDEIESLQDEIAAEHGFRLLSHRHELYGTCPSCR